MPNITPRPARRPRYERLTAWQAVHQLTQALFDVTLRWPRRNALYGEELRASAIAAVQHLVLGSFEPDNAGFRRQVDVSIGKLARIGAAWLIVRDLELVKAEVWGEIEAKRDHAERLTRGLYVALGRKGVSGKPAGTARRAG